jgi:hypothetical protein
MLRLWAHTHWLTCATTKVWAVIGMPSPNCVPRRIMAGPIGTGSFPASPTGIPTLMSVSTLRAFVDPSDLSLPFFSFLADRPCSATGTFFCGPKQLGSTLHKMCNKHSGHQDDSVRFFWNKVRHRSRNVVAWGMFWLTMLRLCGSGKLLRGREDRNLIGRHLFGSLNIPFLFRICSCPCCLARTCTQCIAVRRLAVKSRLLVSRRVRLRIVYPSNLVNI